jgi:hypothetical protein
MARAIRHYIPGCVWPIKVQGSGFKVQGSGFKVQGSGFKVQGSRLKEFIPPVKYA